MQIHIFDFFSLGWIVLFSINGYFIGFWKGIFSIIKWIFTICIFYFGYPIAEKFWLRFVLGELAITALSVITLFIISLIFFSFIAENIESYIHRKVFIRFINRLFGLILGLAKGVFLLLAIVYLMTYLEIKPEWVSESNSGKKINHISNKFINNNEKLFSFFKDIEEKMIKKQIDKVEIIY